MMYVSEIDDPLSDKFRLVLIFVEYANVNEKKNFSNLQVVFISTFSIRHFCVWLVFLVILA